MNLALPSYQEGSLKITLTIPLTFKIKINYIDIFVFKEKVKENKMKCPSGLECRVIFIDYPFS